MCVIKEHEKQNVVTIEIDKIHPQRVEMLMDEVKTWYLDCKTDCDILLDALSLLNQIIIAEHKYSKPLTFKIIMI